MCWLVCDKAVGLATASGLLKSKGLACIAEKYSCGGPELPQTNLAIGTFRGHAAKRSAASCRRPAFWNLESDPFDRRLWQQTVCHM